MVQAFEGRVYFSNASAPAFTCPLQTNFSVAIENCDDRKSETVNCVQTYTRSWLDGAGKERGPVGNRVGTGRR